MLLLIDNYDSFAYNLVHYLGELGAKTVVHRNDALTAAEAMALRPDAIVLSPGPCDPDRAGICLELVARARDSIPVLGVCLGHQAIGQAFGGRVVRAPVPMHGKPSRISHSGKGVFRGLPNPFTAIRYHSLVVDPASLPAELEITARTEDGTVMGLAHRTLPVHGVQFHPESIETEHGHTLLANFLEDPRMEQGSMNDCADALKPLLATVAGGSSLSESEAERAFDIIMSGDATPAQIGAFLMALRVRGETVDEITGAARIMRSKAVRIAAPDDAIDVVGTGGDGSGTLNVSTGAALVVAGCGVPVAKHGNRALSSRAGAADVLTALGVNIDCDMALIEKSIREAGIGFMMAPRHHSATRHVAGPRVELATRTVFNILGPLSNPAGVRRLLVGVFAKQWVEPLAQVLGRLGAEKAWVVHGSDGTDELTTTGPSTVARLENGTVTVVELSPEDAGLPLSGPEGLKGGNAAFNAAAMERMLAGEASAFRDVVVYSAAAALVVADRAGSLTEGAKMAAGAIDSGSARGALDAMVRITNENGRSVA